LIRYASLDEIKGAPHPGVWRRPRVLVYTAIMLLSLVGIVYGLSSVGAIELKVLHSRQPLF
ncbi:MAG: cytochrome c oxidase accessory protein CcoG, partial [Anaerolineae bacterium]|nr:cytochrome c oxidase accessory protein CcoG [Anaerolineae bacterium]